MDAYDPVGARYTLTFYGSGENFEATIPCFSAEAAKEAARTLLESFAEDGEFTSVEVEFGHGGIRWSNGVWHPLSDGSLKWTPDEAFEEADQPSPKARPALRLINCGDQP